VSDADGLSGEEAIEMIVTLAGMFIAAGVVLCGPVNAMSENFALIAPAQAAALERLHKTPEAKSIIGLADAAMLRKPNPRPVLHTEGTLPHQGIYDESVESAKDFEAVRNLAMAWRLTGNDSYLDACNRYYTAWLSTYRLSLNPIDETKFDNFIIAYDFVRERLPAETRAGLHDFLKAVAAGYLENRDVRKSTEINNWQSHRIKLMTLAAFASGEHLLIGRAEEAFERHIDANLRPDGSTFDFKQRDALRYVVYGLEPLILAALAAKAHGKDWYHMKNRDGVSLEVALTWLSPYAEGQKAHEEFVHSTVTLDHKRKKAGVKGYSGMWEPKDAVTLYNIAARLDSHWEIPAKRLGKAKPWMVMALPLEKVGN
jgi:hypothetical protein